MNWCKFCTHLRSLNMHHYRMVEAMGLKKYGYKVIFNGMTCLLNFIKSTNWFKNHWLGGRGRLNSDLIILTFLLPNGLKFILKFIFTHLVKKLLQKEIAGKCVLKTDTHARTHSLSLTQTCLRIQQGGVCRVVFGSHMVQIITTYWLHLEMLL
jgi:hypothetical protein